MKAYYLFAILILCILYQYNNIWKYIRVKKIKYPYWKHISFSEIKVRDKIRVNVGFNNWKQEGVVASKYTGEDNYVWCDVLGTKGQVIHSFTASKSYGQFEILINK